KQLPFCINSSHTNTDEEHNAVQSRRATSIIIHRAKTTQKRDTSYQQYQPNSTKRTVKTRKKKELWNLTQDGWIFYQFSFYYVSTEMKSWNESVRDCMERGANLLKINSTEEQDFASDEEGTWKWVDGIKLTSGIWTVEQPNGKRTELCCVLFNMG
ncbi:hypothetical protein PO909_019135, partial [Leuciscus waleckii]